MTRIVAWIACVACASVAAAQTFQTSGSDFLPRDVNDQIHTDSHNDPGNFDVSNVRVSPYVFGLIDGDPYFTQDPGFNAPAGSNLPGGSILSFNILSNLYYWNGTGRVALTATPAGEMFKYTFGINTRTLTGGANADTEFRADTVVQPGFFIGTVNFDGSLHKHLNAFLLNSAGSADPASMPAPSNGVYFLSIELTDSNPSVAKSQQLYVMYSNGMTTAQQVNASQWLRDNYAPGTNLVNEPIPGDINLDGSVGFPDLLILAQNYGSNNAAWSTGDLNGDGSVGFPDLLVLAQHYGQGTPPAGVAQVPEPACLAPLAFVALLIRRRQSDGKGGAKSIKFRHEKTCHPEQREGSLPRETQPQ